MFERYSSAGRFFNSALCSMNSGGSHPISSLLGARLVVKFLLLLCTAVAMGSHLLHSFGWWQLAINIVRSIGLSVLIGHLSGDGMPLRGFD
jgi:hypothetical protein